MDTTSTGAIIGPRSGHLAYREGREITIDGFRIAVPDGIAWGDDPLSRVMHRQWGGPFVWEDLTGSIQEQAERAAKQGTPVIHIGPDTSGDALDWMGRPKT